MSNLPFNFWHSGTLALRAEWHGTCALASRCYCEGRQSWRTDYHRSFGSVDIHRVTHARQSKVKVTRSRNLRTTSR